MIYDEKLERLSAMRGNNWREVALKAHGIAYRRFEGRLQAECLYSRKRGSKMIYSRRWLTVGAMSRPRFWSWLGY